MFHISSEGRLRFDVTDNLEFLEYKSLLLDLGLGEQILLEDFNSETSAYLAPILADLC